jgi:hypothetical protein
MNIHLPAILGFTRYQGFDQSPYENNKTILPPYRWSSLMDLAYDPRMAVPMVSSAEEVIFGGFKRRVASFRVAGVALRDIQTCLVTCRKSFCVASTILLRRRV